ncbi:MAG TPA: hypothetical protein VFJ14_01960 [Nocardioidaceae bacterium]|nr:hypothetical protein [Nocardioidaceae bacterium]
MENIMTTHTPLAMPVQARLRTFTGAFAATSTADVQGDVRLVAYRAATAAIADVVFSDDFPGVQAWRPPV